MSVKSLGGSTKSCIWAGNLQKQGAAAKKNRDVIEVIRRCPRKATSGQAVSRSRAQRLKKNRDASEVIRRGPRKATPGQAISRSRARRLKKKGTSVRSLGRVQENEHLGRQSPEAGRGGSKKRGRQRGQWLGSKKSYIWAGSVQRQGAAAQKSRDVSEVIRRDPRKATSG